MRHFGFIADRTLARKIARVTARASPLWANPGEDIGSRSEYNAG